MLLGSKHHLAAVQGQGSLFCLCLASVYGVWRLEPDQGCPSGEHFTSGRADRSHLAVVWALESRLTWEG